MINMPFIETMLKTIPEHYLVDGMKNIAAGSARGMAQVFVGHPLDTIKVFDLRLK
jgi:hypothetical protein